MTHDRTVAEYLDSLQMLIAEDIIDAEVAAKSSPKLHFNSDQVVINLPAIVGCLNWIALRSRPDIAWATSRAASLITQDADLCFVRVKHICQYLQYTLSYALRYVPIPPTSKQKLCMGSRRCLLCTDRGEESARNCCLPWYHLQFSNGW